MIQVTVNSQNLLVKAVAPHREESALTIMKEIPPSHRTYKGWGTWTVKNAWKFAHVPAIKNALDDAQRQTSFLEDAN